jgi:hypothetical protein
MTKVPSLVLNQPGMGQCGTLQGGSKGGWVEQPLDETPLVFERQTDDADLLDGPMGGLLGGGNEVA